MAGSILRRNATQWRRLKTMTCSPGCSQSYSGGPSSSLGRMTLEVRMRNWARRLLLVWRETASRSRQ